MRHSLLFGAVMLLGACAIHPPGKDPKGQELMAEATPVLHALIAYEKDRGYYPQSLYELVPKYIPEVPFGPNMNLDTVKKKVEFFYELAFPRSGHVACIAPLGATNWSCLSFR